MSNKHVTIKKVAEREGVSIQTISRVLNNRPDVSPETRQRVQQIISDLGHQPFAIARGFASKRTYLIVHRENWLHGSGYESVKELLKKKQPFTALFAQNDRIARGAINALREANLRVPQDVSTVGYDDIPEAEFSDPPLTTMRQPMQEVGKAAARLLIKMVENPGSTPQQILFDTQLVIRSSCIHR